MNLILSTYCHSAQSCFLDILFGIQIGCFCCLQQLPAFCLAWVSAGHVTTKPWAVDLYGLLLAPAFPGLYCVLAAPLRLQRTLWKCTDIEGPSSEPRLSLQMLGAHCSECPGAARGTHCCSLSGHNGSHFFFQVWKQLSFLWALPS